MSIGEQQEAVGLPTQEAARSRVGTQPRMLAMDQLAAYSRKQRRDGAQRRLVRGVIGVLGLLVLWQAASSYYGLDVILPGPLAVLADIWGTLTLSGSGQWLYGPNIYVHLFESFLRAIVGFAVAAIVAIPTGILVGRYRGVREFLEPVIRLLYPIPGVAWIPLAILWFGLTDKAVIFVVFMAEFFALFFNTEAGVRNINPVLVDAGRCYGASGFKLLWRVILPAATPYIITGMRIALGGAWRMIVAAEMLSSNAGIGYLLNEARFQFRADDLMMSMILIAVVGYATEKILVGTLERRTIERWEVKPL
jgi:ABC-type nitrate/sulfonate/bicarbonate transport system permease component